VQHWPNTLPADAPALLSQTLTYLRSGTSVAFGDLPPFSWIPAVLILPSIILGLIGPRGEDQRPPSTPGRSRPTTR